MRANAVRGPARKHARILLAALPLLGLLALYAIARLLPPPDLTPSTRPSNLILDRQGRLLYEWVDPNGAQHRPIPLEQIAPECIQATIATEDSRFYRHPGVDPIAILRSLYLHWRYDLPLTGASTLTQQLVRIAHLPPEERYRRSLWRKLKEAWLAWRLERHLSKEEILTQYLNRAYYGNFAVGIEAAAHAYFGQPAATLDLAQCALLAGLPQAPAAWNPIAHPVEAKARQRIVLNRMLAEGYITPQERDRALAEPLAFAATPFPIAAPHFVAVVQALVEEQLGVEAVRAGGWVITTTLDLDLQQRAEAIVRAQLYRLNHDPQAPPNRRVTSAAVVVLDPTSGDVLALVGSPNYFDRPNAGAVNGALAPRQPGSAIKPFVYAAAFDPTHPQPWGPATLILDERTLFPAPDGTTYVPQNYDLKWHGLVPARVALAASFNVPAVKALQHAGVDRFLALADRLGMNTLARHPRPGLSLALGSGEVSLLELTAAYAALANGGHRVRPRWILALRRGEDSTLPPPTPPAEPSADPPALDPRVAYLITDILADRHARIPTFGLNSPLELDRPAAAKTGTTTDWRDAWTVGYTPARVVGVWVGNWDNTPMMHLTGGSAAAPIWHAVMTFAHRGLPHTPFPRPDGLKTVRVCVDTGLSADTGCPLVREDLAIAGVPYQRAEAAALARLTTATANTGTPPPPSTRSTPIPTPTVFALSALLSPEPGATYRLSPNLPPDEQAIPIEVRAPAGARVTFRVDGVPIAVREAPPYRAWWSLRVGEHTVLVEGVLPSGKRFQHRVRITVIEGPSG